MHHVDLVEAMNVGDKEMVSEKRAVEVGGREHVEDKEMVVECGVGLCCTR